jgi:hypothetical protein
MLAILCSPGARADLQDGVRPIPQTPRDDRLMLAAVDVPLVTSPM